jgi:malonyl-CoA/methylmalonyl-CoA synthetase
LTRRRAFPKLLRGKAPNLYGLFAAAAAQAGDTPVFVEGGEVRLRYSELDSAVAAWAAALVGLGAKPGDRVLVQAGKSVESALLYLAALRAGLIYVPLNTAYTPAEVAYFIADAEPAIVVAHGDLSLEDFALEPADFEIVARAPDDLAAILFADALPRNAMGKVQKAALRERYKDLFGA